MSNAQESIPLGFTDERFPKSCHVCLVYENEVERQKIISEFLAVGLKRNERVRYYADVTDAKQIREWLSRADVNLTKAEATGAFSIVPATEAYCRGGHFDPKATIAGLLVAYQDLKKAGYPGVRSTGEMSWVHRGIPGSERWLEYEAMLNTMETDFPHHGICQYDARKFDGATLFKVLQLHPYVIAGGMVVRNPYFTTAHQFVENNQTR